MTRKNDVNAKIRSNLLDLLKAVSEPAEVLSFDSHPPVVHLSRLEAEFTPRSSRPPNISRQDRRAEEELNRWLEDPVDIARKKDYTPKELVLEFWQSRENEGDYRISPKRCESAVLRTIIFVSD